MITKNRLFKLFLIVAVIVVSYLVFSKPNYPQSIPHLDKVGHLGSFLLLSYLTYLAFRPRGWVVTASMASYAVMIELVQSYLPYRSASTGDVIADMAGVACFYFGLWLYRKYFNATYLKD